MGVRPDGTAGFSGQMSTVSGAKTVPSGKARSASADSSKWVKVFCSCAFLFFLGVLTHVFGSSDGAGTGPLNVLFLPIALFFQLTAMVLLASPKRIHKSIQLLSRNGALIVALVVIFASTVWSIDSELTLRRAVALLGTTAVGLLIYIEVGRSDVLRFFAVNLALFVVGSILLAIGIPALGTHISGKHAGDWRGLLSFKNQAAWATVLFLLVCLGARMQGRMKRWKYPLLAGGLLMLLSTRSATGIAALGFGIAVLMIMNLYSGSRMLRPLIVTATSVTILMVAMNYQSLFAWTLAALGRDESLTGRTSVWTALWPLIESNLWLGNGYLAFWDHAAEYLGNSSWMVGIGHAHNAYVEILLDVGLIGLLTQVSFLLIMAARLFFGATRGDRDAATMFAILLTLAVIGIAGALFFRPNSGIWIMIVAFACYASEDRVSAKDSVIPPESR
ncbi:MAG: O-antigen ligase family protein [Mycobacterium sp.]